MSVSSEAVFSGGVVSTTRLFSLRLLCIKRVVTKVVGTYLQWLGVPLPEAHTVSLQPNLYRDALGFWVIDWGPTHHHPH